MPQRISIHFLAAKLWRFRFWENLNKNGNQEQRLKVEFPLTLAGNDSCDTKRVTCFDELQESTLCRVLQWIQAGERELMAELHVKSYKSSNSRCRLHSTPAFCTHLHYKIYFQQKFSLRFTASLSPTREPYAMFRSRVVNRWENRAIKSSHHKTLECEKMYKKPRNCCCEESWKYFPLKSRVRS